MTRYEAPGHDAPSHLAGSLRDRVSSTGPLAQAALVQQRKTHELYDAGVRRGRPYLCDLPGQCHSAAADVAKPTGRPRCRLGRTNGIAAER